MMENVIYVAEIDNYVCLRLQDLIFCREYQGQNRSWILEPSIALRNVIKTVVLPLTSQWKGKMQILLEKANVSTGIFHAVKLIHLLLWNPHRWHMYR